MPLLASPLCCIDGSPASLHALSQLIDHGGKDMRLTLAGVVPPLSVDYQGATVTDQLVEDEQNMAQALMRVLQDYRDTAREAGIEAEVSLQHGHPHERIVDLAAQTRASVIVLGAKHEGAVRRRFLGSTTSRVIGFAHRDVLMIPEGVPLVLDPVLVATDGSEYADRAVDRAVTLCSSRDSRLLALSVTAGPSRLDVAPLPSRAAASMDQAAEQVLDQVRSTAEAVGVSLKQPIIRRGRPAEQIAEVAQELRAGLVVVGSHGRTGLTRLLMGSVTERLLELAPCSVLVVPPPAP